MTNAIAQYIIIAAIILSPLILGLSNSFGVRCKKAGYAGAEHEACVIRLKDGGTVYLENMK